MTGKFSANVSIESSTQLYWLKTEKNVFINDNERLYHATKKPNVADYKFEIVYETIPCLVNALANHERSLQ